MKKVDITFKIKNDMDEKTSGNARLIKTLINNAAPFPLYTKITEDEITITRDPVKDDISKAEIETIKSIVFADLEYIEEKMNCLGVKIADWSPKTKLLWDEDWRNDQDEVDKIGVEVKEAIQKVLAKYPGAQLEGFTTDYGSGEVRVVKSAYSTTIIEIDNGDATLSE